MRGERPAVNTRRSTTRSAPDAARGHQLSSIGRVKRIEFPAKPALTPWAPALASCTHVAIHPQAVRTNQTFGAFTTMSLLGNSERTRRTSPCVPAAGFK